MLLGVKFLFGFLLGYLIASLIESYMHEYVSDAPMKYVKRWQRFPRLCWYLIRTRYSHHVIHHVKTFRKNYVTQFNSAAEKQTLDEELRSKGEHGQIILDSNYAVKLHGSGSLVFIAPLIPAAPLLYYTLGIFETLGGLIALSLPPLLSNFVHPHLHMPHREALKKAPRPIAWLMKTWYFRAMARNHYMHHRYVAGNFNLLLGGDIIRGKWIRPSKQDLREMAELGIPVC